MDQSDHWKHGPIRPHESWANKTTGNTDQSNNMKHGSMRPWARESHPPIKANRRSIRIKEIQTEWIKNIHRQIRKNEDQITPIRIMFFSRSFDITAFWSCFIDFLAAPVNLQKFLHSSSLYLAALYCIPCICFLCSSPLNNLQIFLSFRSFYLADLLAFYPYLPSTIFSCLPCISAYLVALLTLQLCLTCSSA